MHLNQIIDNNIKSHLLLEQDLKKILTQIFSQVTDLEEELGLLLKINLARNYNKIINIIFLYYYN